MKVFFFPKKCTGQLSCFRVNRRFFYLLLLTTLVGPPTIFSQTTPLSFTPIPYSDPDIIAPGRGAEQWDNGNEKVNNPSEDTNFKSLDVYYRFPWTRLEDSTAGSYDWTHFDNIIKDAIDNRQKLSFGIMPVFDDHGAVSYDGAMSSYPLYLHKAMQADSVNSRDWISGGVWIPNWNSPHYLGRLRALHEALYAHIMSSFYEGVAYKDAIYCIDIRGYGNYGEWHNAGVADHIYEYPEGRRATATTLKTIIDHHTQVFGLWPLTIMIAAFDAEQFDAIMNPAEVGYYALTTRNAWGPLGWRRDQWGATDNYLDNILKHNEKKFGDSPAFGELIVSRFRTSPVTGEPPNYINDGGPCQYWDLERQVTEYGATSLGNGNWGVQLLSPCGENNARAAFKKTGYRIVLEDGNITKNIIPGLPFSIMLQWKNIGIAPTYENWNVIFELKNSSNVTVWSGTSLFSPKLLIPPVSPSTAATSITDNFTLPASIPTGNYNLNLVIKDPNGYRAPLPLAIKGRNADGSYTLKNIIVSGNLTATLAGTVSLQGRPAPPSVLLKVPLQVDLYTCPDSTLVQSYQTSINANGRFIIPNVPVGTYTIAIKNNQTLKRVKYEQTLVPGFNMFLFGTLRPGDVNNDNVINSFDLSLLRSGISKTKGDTAYNADADFNGDNKVSAEDSLILLNSYQQEGESTSCNCKPPKATVTAASCYGDSAVLKLSAATGPSPYSLTINETMYNNLKTGDTIGSSEPPAYRLWPSNPVPELPSNYDGQSIEVGVKFASPVAGVVKGIRFYNGKNNTGTYEGKLYINSTGELIGSAEFTSVTTNEWQSVLFSTPVAITANTIYVASYYSSAGNYAANSGFFKTSGKTSGITNGLLTALHDSVAGGNGVYKYGGGIPINSYNGANYWVDLDFSPHNYRLATLTNITDSKGCGNSGNLQIIVVSSTDCQQKSSQVVAHRDTKTNLSETITRSDPEIQLEDKKIQLLGQNYPNPFRNETLIQYSLPGSAKVNLSLFDMNGRLVKVLVNSSKEAGTHSVSFNSGSLGSGLYFYKIQAGEFIATRKMIIQ